ncbi:hypothetical protein B0T21DRAFT_440698 [Apiosordaria backusii]|uniref:Uncharacterized protein n=1 Tax=Apiosordaria backusii TaxID=314023 RepID=A0AA40EFF3_9PEZI|nr:hypothetical protein B0T21DRAFT_440698 [Apiosordaria backusii]
MYPYLVSWTEAPGVAFRQQGVRRSSGSQPACVPAGGARERCRIRCRYFADTINVWATDKLHSTIRKPDPQTTAPTHQRLRDKLEFAEKPGLGRGLQRDGTISQSHKKPQILSGISTTNSGGHGASYLVEQELIMKRKGYFACDIPYGWAESGNIGRGSPGDILWPTIGQLPSPAINPNKLRQYPDRSPNKGARLELVGWSQTDLFIRLLGAELFADRCIHCSHLPLWWPCWSCVPWCGLGLEHEAYHPRVWSMDAEKQKKWGQQLRCQKSDAGPSGLLIGGFVEVVMIEVTALELISHVPLTRTIQVPYLSDRPGPPPAPEKSINARMAFPRSSARVSRASTPQRSSIPFFALASSQGPSLIL